MRPRTALLSAGGTGGHLFPAEALGRELIARGWEVHLATDTRASHFLSGFEDIPVHEIQSATPSVASPMKAVRAVLSLARGTGAALGLIRRLKPSVFVGFGGYPTTPPGVAAALMKVPICWQGGGLRNRQSGPRSSSAGPQTVCRTRTGGRFQIAGVRRQSGRAGVFTPSA